MADRALLRPRPHRLVAASLALPALAVLALTGCGSDDGPRVQLASYCQPPSTEHPVGSPVQVEFRQGPTVVARGTVPVGGVLSAEAPPGPVQVWADGVQVGEVESAVATDGPYRSPGPGEGVYLNGEGCPATPTG
jgi:hypothetical protein